MTDQRANHPLERTRQTAAAPLSFAVEAVEKVT
jgi:hypothetical protein